MVLAKTEYFHENDPGENHIKCDQEAVARYRDEIVHFLRTSPPGPFYPTSILKNSLSPINTPAL